MAIEHNTRSEKIIRARFAELATYKTFYSDLLSDSFDIDVSEIHFASDYLAMYVLSGRSRPCLQMDEDLSAVEHAYTYFFSAGCRIFDTPQTGGYVIEDLQNMNDEQLSCVDGNSLLIRQNVDELIIGMLESRGSEVYMERVSDIRVFGENENVVRSLGMIEVLERQNMLGCFPRMQEVLHEYTCDDLSLTRQTLY